MKGHDARAGRATCECHAELRDLAALIEDQVRRQGGELRAQPTQPPGLAGDLA